MVEAVAEVIPARPRQHEDERLLKVEGIRSSEAAAAQLVSERVFGFQFPFQPAEKVFRSCWEPARPGEQLMQLLAGMMLGVCHRGQ